MSFVTFYSIEYEILMGSDVNRDGMFLEVSMPNTNPLRQIAEVFYSDASQSFSLSYCEENTPIELVEYLINEAKKSLPPKE